MSSCLVASVTKTDIGNLKVNSYRMKWSKFKMIRNISAKLILIYRNGDGGEKKKSKLKKQTKKTNKRKIHPIPPKTIKKTQQTQMP